MDHGHRDLLVATLNAFALGGAAVVVATHDPELSAAFADRVVLMGAGEVVADGTPSDVLGSGWYFATETARVLGGAGGALLPADGAAILRARRAGAAAGSPAAPGPGRPAPRPAAPDDGVTPVGLEVAP